MQEPKAFNWYGHRRFVKCSILNDPDNSFLKDDTVIVRYNMELIATIGGALQLPSCEESCMQVILIMYSPNMTSYCLGVQ
jgi:hypothetical protein